MIDRNCYVYEIVVDGVVRYVGKGTRYRMAHHLTAAKRINARRATGQNRRALKFHNRLARAMRQGSEIEARKVVVGLTSQEALHIEIERIATASSGQLWNETTGGDGIDSAFAKRLWKDPEYREKMRSIRSEPAFIEQTRRITVEQFANENHRRNAASRSRLLWGNPEYRERETARLRSRWVDEGFRERHRRGVLKRWDDPDQRRARAEITASYTRTPKARQEASKRFKHLWDDPSFRDKCTSQWRDPEKRKARAAKLTPEFLAKRGRAISEGLARRKAITGSVR